MKLTLGSVYLALGALLALMPVAQVAADGDVGYNGGGPDSDGSQWSGQQQQGGGQDPGQWTGQHPGGGQNPGPPPGHGQGWRPHPPPPPPQRPTVLWGQCGGYYYYGTTQCPKGSYCRWFSDWYSQCNPYGS